MKILVHNTHQIYQSIVEADRIEEKCRLFEEDLLSPFKPAIAQLMFIDVGDLNGVDAVGKWGFALPDDLSSMPASLQALIEFNAWEKSQQILEYCVQQFEPFLHKVDVDTIIYGLFLGKENRTNPLDRGYTGMGGLPGTIFAVYSDPNDYNLGKFAGLLAHEFHHNIHLSVFPWDHMAISLAQWMIYEGMAESFATALYGDDMLGYYVSDFDRSELETTRQIIQNNLPIQGFQQVRSYIYGDALASAFGFEKAGVPAFAGYAIGYEIVQAYLKKTGQSICEATFVPADEIIRVSGYFD